MLTTAQAEAIRQVRINFPVVGSTFYADEVFPARNNQDNARRRTLTALAKRGILGGGDVHSGGLINKLVLTQVAIDAHDEWCRANDEPVMSVEQGK